MSKIRILSMDGGGSRAGIHARTLGRLYGADTPGREIIREFDFVAGNSGGSIVMTALCCNYKPREIADFYDDPVTLRRMFSPTWSARIPILNWLLPRYSSSGKFKALKWIFDRNQQGAERPPSAIFLKDWPTTLESSVNLIVMGFDYDRERATFFRSNRGSRAKSSAPGVDATLVEAVHASTNAPRPYYDEPAGFRGRRYWDGAMGGYDNPVLAAVVEALANRPGEAEDIRVLSLGTSSVARPLADEGAPPPLGKPRDGTGLITTVFKAASVIFGDPPDAANFHAHVALRQPLPASGETARAGNVVRLCPMVRPIWMDGAWRLPRGLNAADFEDLIEMKLDVWEPGELALIRRMCDLWMADELPNQPIRMGDRMRCDIGHETFSAAAAHWKSIS